MSYGGTEHYYALHTFLEDDELHNIWNIVEKAMNRHGFDVSNSELSMRDCMMKSWKRTWNMTT